MGNICRSPTAEGLFRELTEKVVWAHRIEIDSAGTHAYHVGESPDPRAIQVAANRGINLSQLTARQVTTDDFWYFDYILAMDRSNLEELFGIWPGSKATSPSLFLDFAPGSQTEVPDPYYGGIDGYESVIALIKAGSTGLLAEIQKHSP
jgi:protein-tyrosine phosphatase